MSDKLSVLVVGGSYFAGRVTVFHMLGRPERYDVTVLNRGSRPIKREGVTELVADRTDPEAVRSALSGKHFDAVVDYCAYNEGDVRNIFESGVSFDRYVLFSTVNVLEPAHGPLDEDAPRIDMMSTALRTDLPHEVISYITGKKLLEDELVGLAEGAGVEYTIMRPSFIYGPMDYTPRVIWYLQLVAHNQDIPFPSDSDSRFSMVYVHDVARLVLRAIDSEAAANQVFNLAAPDVLDWERFEKIISGLTEGQSHVHMTVRQINVQRIPILLPVDTNEWYEGSRIAEALGGFNYTPFDAGITETFKAMRNYL